MEEREKNLVKNILDHSQSLKEDRKPFEGWYEEVLTYIFPGLEGYLEDRSGKSPLKPENMYDDTALVALKKVSDGYQGYMCPRSSRWEKVTAWDRRLTEFPEVRAWLQDTNEGMNNALNRSNFYDQIGPAFDHGLALGTAPVFAQEDVRGDRPVFNAVHPKEVWIATNQNNQIDTIFHEYQLNGKALLQNFGEKALSGHPRILRDIEDSPYKRKRVLHAMFPREDRIWGKIDILNKAFASVYLLPDDDNFLVRESGFDTLPGTVWRYQAVSRHAYGLSPSFFALVSAIRKNQIAKTLLLMAHLAAQPPIQYPALRKKTLDLSPGGMNPITRADAGISKIDLVGDYPISRDREEQVEQAVRDHYGVDFFAMLSNPDRGNLTATQVIEIAAEKAALMSPQVGRIESELLDPLLERTFQIEYQAGRIPRAPDVLLEYAARSGQDPFKFDYVGPLAQLQKRHHGQQTIAQTMAQLGPLLQIDPATADWINTDQWALNILRDNPLGEDVIRKREEVDQIRQSRAQQAMAQQQAQNMGEVAKALKDMGVQVQGSPLESLFQQAGAIG